MGDLCASMDMTDGTIRHAEIGRPLRDPRVVLIHPPAISKRYLRTKFMPYGMAVLTAFLRAHAVPVMQYDFLMEYLFGSNDDPDYHDTRRSFSEEDFFSVPAGGGGNEDLRAFARKYASRVVPDAGIYAFSVVAYHQFWAALLIAKEIRSRNPAAIVVFGGPFITIKPSSALVPYGIAHFWIKGSGEIPLLMLYRMLHGEGAIQPEQIPGLIRRSGGETVENAQSRLPARDEMSPDFDGLALEPYRYDHPVTGEETLFIPYRISKGCPSRCSFCTGRLVDRYSLKPVDKVVDELLMLSQRYGTAMFQFADASVNGSPRHLGDLCDQLVRRFPEIRWYAYARVNGFSRELLSKAKQAGCFSLFWGVESAYQPTVDLLAKRFRVETMVRTVDAAIDLGIKSYIHIMYNTPHETGEDIAAFTALVERYVRSELVVFLPQRFLLEAHSLMHEDPGSYGLTHISKIPAPPFEREQFTYREADGADHHAIEERHALHRRLLHDHLEWIRYRNLIRTSRNPMARRIPAKLLVCSGWAAGHIPFLQRFHEGAVRWLESSGARIQEQM